MQIVLIPACLLAQVARSSEPKHMFVVMNRLSNENVVEAVCADFQMELTDQFLLYRNDKHEINGIWCGRAASTCAASTRTPPAPRTGVTCWQVLCSGRARLHRRAAAGGGHAPLHRDAWRSLPLRCRLCACPTELLHFARRSI